MERLKKNRIEITELFSLHLGLLLVPFGERPNHVGRKYRDLRKNSGIKDAWNRKKHTDIAKYGLPDNLYLKGNGQMPDYGKSAGEILARIRTHKPVVHSITN